MLKGKNLQPRLLYPARVSFRFDGEIKRFTEKQKLRECHKTLIIADTVFRKYHRSGTKISASCISSFNFHNYQIKYIYIYIFFKLIN